MKKADRGDVLSAMYAADMHLEDDLHEKYDGAGSGFGVIGELAQFAKFVQELTIIAKDNDQSGDTGVLMDDVDDLIFSVKVTSTGQRKAVYYFPGFELTKEV